MLSCFGRASVFARLGGQERTRGFEYIYRHVITHVGREKYDYLADLTSQYIRYFGRVGWRIQFPKFCYGLSFLYLGSSYVRIVEASDVK